MSKLIFEDMIPVGERSAFTTKVKDISKKLKVNPNWLMAIMRFESGFDPGIRNPMPGQTATGLIQFIESTANWLGTSTAALAQMSRVQQLDYVYEYYRRGGVGKYKSYVDMYMQTFYPAAVGKPDSYVVGSADNTVNAVAAANPAFRDASGKVTVGGVKKVMLSKIPKAWLNEFNASGGARSFGVMATLLDVAGIYIFKSFQ